MREGQYDVRMGAAAYAPLVSVFGSLSVPAIVVMFSLTPKTGENPGLAVGLLVVGLFSSLLGAIGLAAIGAERDPTGNLAAAVMYIAVPVVVAIAGVLSAFEVLAAAYIPTSATLFALILAAGGLFGVIFNSFSIADAPGLGPTDRDAHSEWLGKQWLSSREKAYRWTLIVAWVCSMPIVAGACCRVFGLTIDLNTTGADVLVGVGIVLALAGTLLSVISTAHPVNDDQHGLKGWTAFGTNLAISLYILSLLIFIP